jgi:hypothetical protein
MPKPACPKCSLFFRPKVNGTAFVECMPIGQVAPAGNAAPEAWKPYKLWIGDLWDCRGCGAEIIVGAPVSPLAEHYQKDFATEVSRVKATILIWDC